MIKKLFFKRRSLVSPSGLARNRASIIRVFLTAFVFLASLSLKAQASLNFDGVDDFVQTTYAGVQGNGARTVEAWIRPFTVSLGQQVITEWGGTANGSRFTLKLAANKLCAETGTAPAYILTGTTLLTAGTWYHVAVTYDPALTANPYKIFINGVLEAQGSLTSTGTTSASLMQIGARASNVPLTRYKGNIDDFRVWNVARTTAQILADKDIEYCGAMPGLVAYYKFNEGTPGATNTFITSLIDSSVTASNGNFVGFALTGSANDSSNYLDKAPNLNAPTVNNAVTVSNTTLTATQTGATYQWIDCGNGNTDIAGATLASYVTTATGSYAVRVKKYGCTVTSACTPVTNVVPCAVDATVTLSGTTLTAVTQTGATYQWVDCANAYAPVTGATAAAFTPTVSGNYAVIISSPSACVVTSACTFVCVLKPVVTQGSDGTLTVTPVAGALYQWINCASGNTPMLGATTTSFTPTIDGNYAVMVTTPDGCMVITACTQVTLQLFPNAINFDGSTEYVPTTYAGITGNGARTVEAWVKIPTNNATTQRFILDWGTSTASTTAPNKFAFNISNNKLRLDITPAANITGAFSLNDGNWHHVAVTYDPAATTNSIVLYVDGVQDGAGSPSVPVNTSTAKTVQLGYGVGSTGYFNGSMDEVRIWDVVRTPAEIAGAMNTELCTIPSSLKAYYKFNKGVPGGLNTGQTTLPDSAGSNPGTLNGFALTGGTSNWVAGIVASGAPPTTVTLSGITLTANAVAGATYQWIDCGNVNAAVPGATAAAFTPTVSGHYAVIITASNGCMATSVCTQVTVCNVNIAVTLSGTTLTAVTQTGVTYQWVDCANAYAPISGATAAAFTPTVSGNYAVMLTTGSCTTTSACTQVCIVNPAVTLAGTTLTAAQTGATYQWVNCADNTNITGATAQTYTPTAGGSYKVVITMPGNCTVTSACTQVCIVNPAVTLAGTTLIATQTGATYQWVNCADNTNITGATAQTYTSTVSGSYKVVITMPGNCTATSACTQVTVCNVNTAVTLSGTTLTAAQTGATYQWVDCANANAPVSGATAVAFTPTVSGNYAVMITVGSCTATSACTQVCIVNPAVTLAGTTLTATQAGATYQWVNCADNTNITGATAQTYTPTAGGSYKVVITMPGNCTATSACTQVCIVNPAVTLAGTTLTATQTGATYQWVNCADNTNITGATAQTYTPTAGGSYKVVITMPGNCTATSACTQVCIVNPAVTLAGTTLTATQAGATYQWVNCADNTNITGATAQTYTPTAGGSYKVVITMPGNCTATSACTQVCIVNPAVTLAGTTLTATQTGATYQWVNCADNTNITGATAQTYTPTAGGSYKVVITMPGNCTATSACTQVCIVNPAVTLAGTTLTATQTGATYQWVNCADNTNITGATAQTYTPTAGGSYKVVITMPGNCTATSACTQVCIVNPAVTLAGTTLTATQTGATYQWVNCADNTNIIGATAQTYTPIAGGSYKVVITMPGNCTATSACTQVCILNGEVTLNGTMLTAAQANAAYQWVDCANANAPISGANAQTFTPEVTGNYAVIISTPDNCTITSGCTEVLVCNVNTGVVNNAGMLTATEQEGASYQWIDCTNNNEPIADATGSNFTPSVSGNYAVIVSLENGCTATSACQFVLVCNLNNEVTVSGTTLTAAQTNASYQWIDCGNNNEPVEGASGITFTPTVSGSYAVIITTSDTCTATSDCYETCIIDGTVVNNEGTLTAMQAGATYQWINCADNEPVEGATSAVFTPVVSGNYAVQVWLSNECTSTSDCEEVTVLGRNGFDFGRAIQLYPNPTTGLVTITMGDVYDAVTMTVYNIAGQVVNTQAMGQTQTFTTDLSNVARGVYFIYIKTGTGQSAVLKVIRH